MALNDIWIAIKPMWEPAKQTFNFLSSINLIGWIVKKIRERYVKPILGCQLHPVSKETLIVPNRNNGKDEYEQPNGNYKDSSTLVQKYNLKINNSSDYKAIKLEIIRIVGNGYWQGELRLYEKPDYTLSLLPNQSLEYIITISQKVSMREDDIEHYMADKINKCLCSSILFKYQNASGKIFYLLFSPMEVDNQNRNLVFKNKSLIN